MREDMDFVLLFSVNDNAKQLNIGDEIAIDYDRTKSKYRAFRALDKVPFGEQLYKESEASELLNFIANKINKQLCVWDDEFVAPLFNVYGEIIAIDNHYMIVKPYCQNELWDILDNKTNANDESQEKDVEDFLNDLIQSLSECENIKEKENAPSINYECAEKEKEETNMFQSLNASFGKINSNQFRLSINGLAVRGNDGKYYTFNPETKELVEVSTGFFDDMRDLLFLMPTTELEVGDVILHQDKPYFITSVKEGNIKGIDFEGAIENVLIPKTNVFGMKYYTKVFNCLGTNNILGSDIASNPMMAYALMGGKDFDLSKVMMFQALSGQGNGIADFSENPIMLMALMGNESGRDLSDFAKMQILSQLSAKKKPAKETRKEN